MANEVGWIKLHRAINDNPLWLSEPFNRAQAWVDLILNANFVPGEMCVRGNIVKINRGEIGWSELTMAGRWKWSKGKVRRFLSYLELSGNIVQQKSFITTVISICNYERYQSSDITDRTADRTADSTANGQQTVHDIRREEEEEGKEVKNPTTVSVKRYAFTAPTKQETASFFETNGSTIEEASKYWYHYDANGWMVGKVKMKSWTSAAKKWITNSKTIYLNGNGSTAKRNGTLVNQQPISLESLPRIMQSIADDNRYA
jgi:hypothetical protein